jgi:hypothetical protein
VEDRYGNSLADFGSVTFLGCLAKAQTARKFCWDKTLSRSLGLWEADLINMEESGGDKATAQSEDENTNLVVTYIT